MSDQGTEGFFSPFLRKRRIEAARPYLQGCILDVGCGSGALAAEVSPDGYIGFDADAESLALASRRFPGYRFIPEMPEKLHVYDTIVALAVVEHIDDPVFWLRDLSERLAPDGRIVLTTPHPIGRKIHEAAARIGFCSRHAAEEHKDFISPENMRGIAAAAGLHVVLGKNFLMGLNQLFVLSADESFVNEAFKPLNVNR